MIKCECCNQSYKKNYFSKHEKSKKHINNMELYNLKKIIQKKNNDIEILKSSNQKEEDIDDDILIDFLINDFNEIKV